MRWWHGQIEIAQAFFLLDGKKERTKGIVCLTSFLISLFLLNPALDIMDTMINMEDTAVLHNFIFNISKVKIP